MLLQGIGRQVLRWMKTKGVIVRIDDDHPVVIVVRVAAIDAVFRENSHHTELASCARSRVIFIETRVP